ncbi:MAG: glycosyltransferase family 39 protein [Flavobacteriales bacterium]|nr:glycosyltransferase family 39 protein [Flavobacteriales bacterium]
MDLKGNKHIFLLLVVSILAYLPILFNGFTYYSDDNYILNNPLIQSFSTDNISLIFTSFFDGHYHPLTLLSFSFNYFFSGESPFGYQLTNLMLNAVNSCLVYILVLKLFNNKNQALIVALIFALHPLHVESVARITERKDTLFALFFLASCISYIVFIESKKFKKYGLAILFFVLALLSKGQAVTLPITLLIISFFILGYNQGLKQLKYILPLFLLSGLFGFLNLKAQLYTGYFLDTTSIPFINNVISAGYVLTNYIFKLFFPIQLSPHYPYPFDLTASVPKIYYLFTLIFPVVLAIIYFFRKNKTILLGLLFYLSNIFLMIRFIPVAENVMPDRYNYLPIIGFVIILYYLLEKVLKKKLMLGVYIVLGLFFIKSFTQSLVWKNGIKVWETAHKYYPNDSEINQNLGSHYYSNGKIDKALKFTNKAIELDTNNILAFINRSNIFNSQQNYKASLNDLKSVLQVKAISAKDLSNQSAVLIQIGEFEQALVKNKLAIEKNPYDAKLYYNQAAILLLLKQFDNGLLSINKCIELVPFYIGDAFLLKSKLALYNYDVTTADKAFKEAKKYTTKKESVQNTMYAIQNVMTYETALKSSKNAKELNTIGLTFYNLGFYQIAINYFEKAISLDENYSPGYQNLVYSYYATGDWYKTFENYKLVNQKNIVIDGKVKQQLINLEIINL